MNRSDSALRVYYMAHRFLDEFGIKWLPVNPEDIIDQRPNWRMKYVSQLAYETGQTEEHILHHVMRRQDGLSMYVTIHSFLSLKCVLHNYIFII
jgi:hypothetical protein